MHYPSLFSCCNILGVACHGLRHLQIWEAFNKKNLLSFLVKNWKGNSSNNSWSTDSSQGIFMCIISYELTNYWVRTMSIHLDTICKQVELQHCFKDGSEFLAWQTSIFSCSCTLSRFSYELLDWSRIDLSYYDPNFQAQVHSIRNSKAVKTKKVGQSFIFHFCKSESWVGRKCVSTYSRGWWICQN